MEKEELLDLAMDVDVDEKDKEFSWDSILDGHQESVVLVFWVSGTQKNPKT